MAQEQSTISSTNNQDEQTRITAAMTASMAAHRDKIHRMIEAKLETRESYTKIWDNEANKTIAQKVSKLFADYNSKKKAPLHPKRSHHKEAKEVKDFCDKKPSDQAVLDKLFEVTKPMNIDPQIPGSFGRRALFAINQIEQALSAEQTRETTNAI